MASRDETLREKTFKDEGLETARRVFYTLKSDEKLASLLTSKALALLVELLVEKNLISQAEIDALLLECVPHATGELSPPIDCS